MEWKLYGIHCSPLTTLGNRLMSSRTFYFPRNKPAWRIVDGDNNGIIPDNTSTDCFQYIFQSQFGGPWNSSGFHMPRFSRKWSFSETVPIHRIVSHRCGSGVVWSWIDFSFINNFMGTCTSAGWSKCLSSWNSSHKFPSRRRGSLEALRVGREISIIRDSVSPSVTETPFRILKLQILGVNSRAPTTTRSTPKSTLSRCSIYPVTAKPIWIFGCSADYARTYQRNLGTQPHSLLPSILD